MSDANNAAKSGSNSDAMNVVGECPLKQKKLQLIPVRFGLVENLAVEKKISVPFKTQSKPLGIRLLRDGWLYVVVEENQKWLLHEYRVEKGVITKLLWSNTEVTKDVRTTSVGDASLVFNRSSTLYTSYSELQWTAAKCSQVIKSNKDRERFMQKVRLSSFNPTEGSQRLLTSKQASSLIAECAEKNQEKTKLDYKDYEWEHKTLFAHTSFSTLNSTVLSDYKKDHAYLIFNDDIGVLRDLASYQSLVAGSIEDWQADEKSYQKYIEGCYIETQLRITPDKVDQVAVALGSDSFSSKLNQKQKDAVVAWIAEFDDKYDDWTRPTVGEKYREMEKALGKSLMSEYKELIYDIQSQFEKELQGVPFYMLWKGSEIGTQGIKDLIDQEAMEIFLTEERKKLAYWDSLLKTITEDRTKLFMRFYYAAWYYDASTSQQLGEFLAAEYSCIQDICWNDSASALVAKELEKLPWVSSMRGIFTLSADAYDKLTEEILKRVKEAKDIANSIQEHMKDPEQRDLNKLGAQFNSLLSTDFSPTKLINLHEHLKGFSNLIDSSYTPATTLALTDTVERLFSDMNRGKTFNPGDVLRNFSGAAWMDIFKAYNNQGLSIGFANSSEVNEFNHATTEAQDLRAKNTSLRNKIRQAWAIHRKNGLSGRPDVSVWEQSHESNQKRLFEIETKINNAIEPYGEGPAKVGFHIKGLTDAQKADIKQMASDLRSAKQIKVVKNLNGWDGLAAVLAGFAVYNAAKSVKDYMNNPNKKGVLLAMERDISNAVGACFGLAQGIRAGYDLAAVNNVQSATAKLVYGAKLGKWTTALGGAAYFFGLPTSSIKSIEAYQKLHESVIKGDQAGMIKNAVDMSAEGTMAVVNGYGFVQSAMVGRAVFVADKASKAVIWASNSARLLSIGARINLIGLIVSAVQLGGTVIYNRWNLTKYMQWFEHCQWGDEPTFSSLQQSNEQLAKISTKPVAAIMKLKKGNVFTLTMPRFSLEQLTEAGVEISAYWLVDQQKNDWQPWTTELSQQWVVLSESGQPLQLGLPIYKKEANANHGIAIELRYLATPDSTEKTVVRYQNMNLNRIGVVNEVKQLKVRNPSDANFKPLTTDQIAVQVS